MLQVIQAMPASEAPASQAMHASQGHVSSASATVHASQEDGFSASQEENASALAQPQPGSVHQGCTDRKKRDLPFSMVCHFQPSYINSGFQYEV